MYLCMTLALISDFIGSGIITYQKIVESSNTEHYVSMASVHAQHPNIQITS